MAELQHIRIPITDYKTEVATRATESAKKDLASANARIAKAENELRRLREELASHDGDAQELVALREALRL